MITGIIKGQELRITAPVTVADSRRYLQAVFAFQSADWNGLDKWAHFSLGDKTYDIRLENDKIGRDKNLNLSSGDWKIYVHGDGADGMRITTNEARLTVYSTGSAGGEVFPEIPPGAAEQISADAREAREIAERLRSDAESGKFNGAPGKNAFVELSDDGAGNVSLISHSGDITLLDEGDGNLKIGAL